MQWTCHKCDTTIIGYKPEHCTVCHETFTCTHAGAMHRIGEHGVKEGPHRRMVPHYRRDERQGHETQSTRLLDQRRHILLGETSITPSHTRIAHTN